MLTTGQRVIITHDRDGLFLGCTGVVRRIDPRDELSVAVFIDDEDFCEDDWGRLYFFAADELEASE